MEIRHWILTKLNVALVDKLLKKAGLHTMTNANCRKKDNFQNYSHWFKWRHAPFPLLFSWTCSNFGFDMWVGGWWVEDLSLIESACSATWPWHIAPSKKNYAPDERQSGGGQNKFLNHDLLRQKSRFTSFWYKRWLKVQSRLTQKINR